MDKKNQGFQRCRSQWFCKETHRKKWKLKFRLLVTIQRFQTFRRILRLYSNFEVSTTAKFQPTLCLFWIEEKKIPIPKTWTLLRIPSLKFLLIFDFGLTLNFGPTRLVRMMLLVFISKWELVWWPLCFYSGNIFIPILPLPNKTWRMHPKSYRLARRLELVFNLADRPHAYKVIRTEPKILYYRAKV